MVRQDATSPKLPNAFNASSPTFNGVTFNEMIHSLPKLQNQIFDILTRIYRFAYVYSRDITKILLRLEDQIRLRILWWAKPEDPIRQ